MLIDGRMGIRNDRMEGDFANIGHYWEGMEQGIDGYPKKQQDKYLIAGGKSGYFKA